MTLLRILCQLVTLPLCFVGLALAHIGGALCRAADGISKAGNTDSSRRTVELAHWDGARWLIGHDGKARRVEPNFCLLVDGLSDTMDYVLSIERQAAKKVEIYAAATETRATEILQVLRNLVAAQAVRGSAGGLWGISEATVLLGFLCSLRAALGQSPVDDSCGEDAAVNQRRGLSSVNETRRSLLLRLRRYEREASRSPRRWESEERPCNQLPDFVHQLSQLLAQDAQAHREACLNAHAAANRISLLRGFGNAIAPQIAAEMMAAWMEEFPA